MTIDSGDSQHHGSTWYDYLTDQQGSTMGSLKQDGTTAVAYSYSDFGETTARYGATFNNEICYTGAVYDNDFGEYYLNARYYDPATANFLSQDTYRGDTGDYGQWNLYTYCANDPINYYDPTGHFTWELPVFGLITAAIIVTYIATQLANNITELNIRYTFDEIYNMAQKISALKNGATQALSGIKNSVKKSKEDKKNEKKHVHHIVAKAAKKAEGARNVLDHASLSVENKHNKVKLKQHFHSHLHNDNYYNGVNTIMKAGEDFSNTIIKKAKIRKETVKKKIRRACCYADLAGLKGTLKAANVIAH